MPHWSGNPAPDVNRSTPEPYQTMKINIDFRSAGIQTVAITSIRRREGRTETALQLAMAYAESGQRVLLIDADLRNPGIHAAFGRNSMSGLSRYLANSASLTDVIETTMHEHLSVIKSGPAAQNPPGLLASDSMTHLLEEVKTLYDKVVIDCPPLGYIEGKITAARCDGAVLVMEYGKISTQLAEIVKDELLKARVNLIGTVVNKSKAKEAYSYPY
jgi:capsular exopolysaccharide synthesis family protein